MTENPPLSEYAETCKFFDANTKECNYPFGFGKTITVMCRISTCKTAHHIESVKTQIQNHPLYAILLRIEEEKHPYCVKYYGKSDEELDAEYGEGIWNFEDHRCIGCPNSRDSIDGEGYTHRSCDFDISHSLIYSILNNDIKNFKTEKSYNAAFFEK